MSNDEKRRRNVLRSIATVGVGITGGIAANGTAKARDYADPGKGGTAGPLNHGEITIKPISNDWNYEIITPIEAGHELQKGDEGEDVDIGGLENHLAYGEISEGDLHNLWLHSDSAVEGIRVTVLDDSGSPIGLVEIEIEHGPQNKAIRVSINSNPDLEYSYTCEFDGGNLGSSGFQNSPDSIDKDVTGGTVSSTLSADDSPEGFYRSAKHPDLIEIEDGSGGSLNITLPN